MLFLLVILQGENVELGDSVVEADDTDFFDRRDVLIDVSGANVVENIDDGEGGIGVNAVEDVNDNNDVDTNVVEDDDGEGSVGVSAVDDDDTGADIVEGVADDTVSFVFRVSAVRGLFKVNSMLL